MSAIRFLIVEGNTEAARESHRRHWGMTPSQSYAALVSALEPGAVTDIALPADPGANLPDPAGLQSYDGIFLTGSALNIYDEDPAISRQIDFMREAYRSGTPIFGSCWGIQLGTVAAGGCVRKNPKGRELGIARRIMRTPSGEGHPLLAGRGPVWDAPCIHLDEVATPPADMTVLARNEISDVQAAEIRHGDTIFWGVQYHPEFSLLELASIMRRRVASYVQEGFARSAAALMAYIDDLDALGADKSRTDLSWKLAIGKDVLDDDQRTTELRNFIAYRVKPHRSLRARA